MISCSHHGDHGCVPQAASATPIASASSSSARRCSTSLRAASGNDSQRPVLTSISDEISSPAVCSPSGDRVGARLELGEAVDEVVRLGVDDLELLLDREGEILRAVEDAARLVERRKRVRDAQAHRREVTSAFVLQTRPESADTARVERSRRSYFLLLGMACVARLVHRACGPCRSSPSSLLEAVWTVAEWTRERGPGARAGPYVR